MMGNEAPYVEKIKFHPYLSPHMTVILDRLKPKDEK